MQRHLLIGVLFVLASLAAADGDQEVEQRLGPDVASLLSNDEKVRAKGYEDWRLRRLREAQFLVKLAGQEKKQYDNAWDSRELAIRMLGDLGQCNPVLFKYLDWPAPGEIARSGWLVQYPCAEAIAKCGKDSALSLLDYLAKLPEGELSEKQVVLGALVVLVAYGRQNQDEAVEAVKIRMMRVAEGQEANFKRLFAATKSGLQANLERLSELKK